MLDIKTLTSSFALATSSGFLMACLDQNLSCDCFYLLIQQSEEPLRPSLRIMIKLIPVGTFPTNFTAKYSQYLFYVKMVIYRCNM